MRRKRRLSLLMLGTGVALLVAATTVGLATANTNGQRVHDAKRGGVLRLVQSGYAFDTLDPQLAYVVNDWAVLRSTQLLLLNYPDKAGRAGMQLVPEAAKALPTISKNGRIVTFHLRRGLRFSNGKPVTAKSFQRAFERVLSPKMYAQYGCFDQIDKMIVGGTKFANCAGKKGVRTSAHISGIEAKGLTLTFHLTKPSATFLNILGMQWFGAIPPNLKYTSRPGGIHTYPSAGPYYLASNNLSRLTVLKRNPYYHGARPANPDEIVIHSYPNANGQTAVLQIEKGEADLDLYGVPAGDVARLAKKYGVNRKQFHVGSTSCTLFLALNTAKVPTNITKIRKAINYAIGRKAILALAGPYAGTPSSQLLVPGLPGYEKISVYPAVPNLERARQVGGSAVKAHANDQINVYYNASVPLETNVALYEQKQLQQLGFKNVKLQAADPTDYFGQLQTKRVATSADGYNLAFSGWCADYFDPFDYLNVNFDGRTISDAGNSNLFYFDSPAFNRKMDHAASLSGKARSRAYAKLDVELMTKYAPIVPLYAANARYLTSKRVKNYIYSNYYTYPSFNAIVLDRKAE